MAQEELIRALLEITFVSAIISVLSGPSIDGDLIREIPTGSVYARIKEFMLRRTTYELLRRIEHARTGEFEESILGLGRALAREISITEPQQNRQVLVL